MANYIATKPCTFAGNDYVIGDAIDAGAVDPSMADFLIRIGLIAYENTTQESEPETAIEAEKEEPESGEIEPKTDTETADISAENEGLYTKAQLVRMTKNELLEIGHEKGLALTDDLTKAQVTEAILLYQNA